jgi:hypothetical protein
MGAAAAVTGVAQTSAGSVTTSVAPAPVTTTTTTAAAPPPTTANSSTTPTSINPPTADVSTSAGTPTAPPSPAAPVAPSPPVTQPCTGGSTSGTAASGATGASSPPTAASASPTSSGTSSCGTPTTAPVVGATVTTGAGVTGDAAVHGDPASSQPNQPPGFDGGAAAPAATPTPPATSSAPTHPSGTQAPAALHRNGSDVRLLARFPARKAGRTRTRRAGSQRGTVQAARNASSRGGSLHRPGAANAAANALMPHVIGATAASAPSWARAWVWHGSSAASSHERLRAHGARRTHDGPAPAAVAPPEADPSPASHGGRPTRGVGLVVPGGTAAPSSLMVRVGCARVAASWLAGVTGEAIHLQFPVTHRLERPG